VHFKYIPIYIHQDSTLHSLFISGNCSTCFGWYFHPSSGAHTTVTTASGICHTVTAICRYRGRVGTGLSVLWVAYATHSTLNSPTLICFGRERGWWITCNYPSVLKEKNIEKQKEYNLRYLLAKARTT
jgi:hypothetical protein